MPALMFYEDVAVLDRALHRDLKLKPLENLAFAATAPAVPVVTGEFADVAREYPIAFLRAQGGGLLPAALTGAREGQNLFVDAQGCWNARYIPAFVRRYPFVFAATGDDRMAVCIDETWPGFGEDEGDDLFDATGEPSAMLKGVLAMLADYQRQITITEAFMARLAASGLLVEAAANAELGDGRHVALRGFMVVDEARFRALPDATLKEWFASGELALLYAHLLSLRNLLDLAKRLPA